MDTWFTLAWLALVVGLILLSRLRGGLVGWAPAGCAPLELKRWDSPPDQHRIEGKLLS